MKIFLIVVPFLENRGKPMESQTALARKELRNHLRVLRKMTPPLKTDPNHAVATDVRVGSLDGKIVKRLIIHLYSYIQLGVVGLGKLAAVRCAGFMPEPAQANPSQKKITANKSGLP